MAAHAVVDEDRVYQTIAGLKRLGAEGILVTRIERLMPSGGSREYVEQLTEYMIASDGDEGERHMESVQYEDQRPYLETITAPTLALSLEDDRFQTIDAARHIATLPVGRGVTSR